MSSFLSVLPDAVLLAVLCWALSRLGRHRQLLQGSLDQLGNPIAILATNGTIVLANRAWQELAGKQAGVLRDKNYLIACRAAAAAGEMDSQAILNGLSALLQGHISIFQYEYCRPGTAGMVYWLKLRATPVRAGNRVHVLIEQTVGAQQRGTAEQRRPPACTVEANMQALYDRL